MAGEAFGFLSVCFACLLYGSYFVPARKYEIHDGVVFQWFQCSGVLLFGLMCGMVRNCWNTGSESSPGFYVCPEGLIGGLVFVLANATANLAVKTCGIGVYYTMHEVSNLGVTFVVGVFGPRFGIPATPPSSVTLAGVGVALVVIGAVPIAFMEPEVANGRAVDPPAAPELMEPPLESLFVAEAPRSRAPSASPARSGAGSPTSPVRRSGSAAGSAADGAADRRGGQAQRAGAAGSAAGSAADRRSGQAQARDWSNANSLTWDGTVGRARLNFEIYGNKYTPSFMEGLVHVEIASELGDDGAIMDAPLLSDPAAPSPLRWYWGVALSLIAGFLYSLMYVPQILFKARAEREGWSPSGFDGLFSLTVGIYCGSSAWLICASAWKRYQGQALLKPVLRPALVTGAVYGGAMVFNLLSMMLLPYVVAYALGVGGAMLVSQAWGIVVFGEASTAYNRRLVGLSFCLMAVGVACLGLSA